MSASGVESDGPDEAVDATAVLAEYETPQLASRHQHDAPLDLQRGDVVGRYVVLEELGAGGMGVVLAAYDPELDRKVAVKLLRSDVALGPDAHARLVQEAQAMAKVSHPNVITVHDVGTYAGSVFMAMEFVEGEDLRAWVEREHVGWQQVLDVYTQAARGLAAAHGAGLVHRDFKPENVLVDATGTARVLDFGLARPVGSTGENVAVPSSESEDVRLTQPGAIMGTPAYMSPEQHLGLPTDARTDQFSFCVSLYEALYGTRPFAGSTRAQLALAVTEGDIDEPAWETEVPQWLRRAIVRGLARDEDARWPDMASLLDALRGDPNARRRRVGVVVAAGLGVLGAAIWIATRPEPEPTPAAGVDPCAEAGDVSTVLPATRRAQIQQRFGTAGVPYASATWASVERTMDGYLAAVSTGKRSVCEAAKVRGEISDRRMDLQMSCYGRRVEEAQALLRVLEEADAAAVQNARQSALALTPVAVCGDVDALEAAIPLPDDPEERAAVARLRAELTRIRVLTRVASYAAARAGVTEVLDRAQSLEYGPLLAEALVESGVIEDALGQPEQAERAWVHAGHVAAAAMDDHTVAKAWIHLVGLRGYVMADEGSALAWAESARAMLQRSGTGPRLRALLHANLGLTAHRAGRFDEAEAEGRKAIEAYGSWGGHDPLQLADYEHNLGLTQWRRGDFEAAEQSFRAALEAREAELGVEHPATAAALDNVGRAQYGRRALVDARESHTQALARREAALGDRHPDVATSLVNLANVDFEEGKFDDARTRQTRALEIREASLGENHPDVADVLNNLANLDYEQDRLEPALQAHLRVLHIREEVLGSEHPDVAMSHANLGLVLKDLGNLESAVAHLEAALQVWNETLGPEHPNVGYLLLDMGLAEAGLGRKAQAKSHLERARGIAVASRFPQEVLDELDGALAKL